MQWLKSYTCKCKYKKVVDYVYFHIFNMHFPKHTPLMNFDVLESLLACTLFSSERSLSLWRSQNMLTLRRRLLS